LAILEGAFPEMSHVADALNKLREEITNRIAQARTPEEIEQLSKEVDELMSDYQKCLGKVMAETKCLDKQSRKQ
jgi:archaellum component FlaC